MATANRFLVCALLAVLTIPAAVRAASVSRDINTYVLFALDDLSFKGRNADVTRGFILGGNVGVNRVEPNTNGFLLTLGGASADVVMSSGTQVVADSMALSTKFTFTGGVGDLFSNRTGQLPTQAGHYSSLSTFTAPILTAPVLQFNPASNTSTTDLTVDDGNTPQTLAPGSYRDVWVKDDGVLNFGSGEYFLRNLKGGKDVTINVTDGTILYINGFFSMNDGPDFGVGTTSGAKVYVASINDTFNDLGANDFSVAFGSGGAGHAANIHAQFYAPNGIMNLGNHSDLYGRYWAEKINGDFNNNVTFEVPFSPGPSVVPLPATLWMGALLLSGLALHRLRRHAA